MNIPTHIQHLILEFLGDTISHADHEALDVWIEESDEQMLAFE